MRFLLPLLGLLLLSSPASALKVEELREYCGREEGLEFGFCIGFILGASDSISTIARVDPVASRAAPFCAPEGLTYGEMRQIFLGWAEEHPERSDDRAVIGVLDALRTALPCRRADGP
jgi:hypothetical protein